MIMATILGAPVWVWPLLVFLIWVGIRASKTRTVSVALVYLLPLVGLVSINSNLNLPNQQLVWLTYAIAYGFGVFVGYSLQRKWLLEKAGSTVKLAGEWFTMATIMIIFWANFVSGFVRAVAPDMMTDRTFLIVLISLIAGAAGTFSGRALNVWRARQTTS